MEVDYCVCVMLNIQIDTYYTGLFMRALNSGGTPHRKNKHDSIKSPSDTLPHLLDPPC